MKGMAAQIAFDWRDAVFVDFKVMKEEWQRYSLSDGSVIRAKLILTSIYRTQTQTNPIGEPLYTWNFVLPIPAALISYPDRFKGEQTTVPITPESLVQNIDESVDFEMAGSQDEWNVYNLKDGSVLRLRLNLTGVQRTKFHSATGEPLYNLSAGPPNYRIKIAPLLIKKQKSSGSTSKSSLYG
jgi:hypothetical protein